MPRIRTIKPEIAADVCLARISRESRYTFVLIISQADDQGFLLGNPRQLLGSLFPHDEDVTPDVLHGWIAELEGAGMVQWRVRDDGHPVLQVTNWQRHQKVDHPHKPILESSVLPTDDARHDAFLARISRNPRESVASPSRTDHTTLQPYNRTTDDHTTLPPTRKKRELVAGDARTSWLTPVADVWDAFFDPGAFAVVAKQAARELSPLRKHHADEEIARRLKFYLTVRGDPNGADKPVERRGTSTWAPNLRNFASTFGTWNPTPATTQGAA